MCGDHNVTPRSIASSSLPSTPGRGVGGHGYGDRGGMDFLDLSEAQERWLADIKESLRQAKKKKKLSTALSLNLIFTNFSPVPDVNPSRLAVGRGRDAKDRTRESVTNSGCGIDAGQE